MICNLVGTDVKGGPQICTFQKCEDNLGDSEGSAREGKMTYVLHALHAAPADARSTRGLVTPCESDA